jgi:hypothetical protein
MRMFRFWSTSYVQPKRALVRRQESVLFNVIQSPLIDQTRLMAFSGVCVYFVTEMGWRVFRLETLLSLNYTLVNTKCFRIQGPYSVEVKSYINISEQLRVEIFTQLQGRCSWCSTGRAVRAPCGTIPGVLLCV